jgi:hypothetical protein
MGRFEEAFQELPSPSAVDLLVYDGKTLLTRANEIEAEILAFRKDNPNCRITAEDPEGETVDLLEIVLDLARQAIRSVTRVNLHIEAVQKTFCKNFASLSKMNEDVRYVKTHPETLIKQYVIGPFKTHTIVKIDVKPIDQKRPANLPEECTSSGAATKKAEAERESIKPALEAGAAPRPAVFFSQRVIRSASAANNTGEKLRIAPVSYFSWNPPSPQNLAAAPAQAETSSQNTEVEFGSYIFGVSGGVVVTPLRKREFQLEPSAGAPVIGFKQDSRSRVLPMLMLHIREDHKGRYHATFGITAKRENNETDIEYLFGQSIKFLQNNLYFTTGLYLGRQQELAGDLQIGGTLPAFFEGTVPARKKWKAHVGFALSFHLLPR